jgi:aminotransferase in exopolysaccharide biosynthesis
VDFIRAHFNTKEFIPLHSPVFPGREKEYLNECIDSTFVSYVGRFVGTFEEQTAAFTGAKYAVACVNGTAALHIALVLAGVKDGDEVISPALTFVATANAIAYCRAYPLFADCERDTLGLDPVKLGEWLTANAEVRNDGCCYNKSTGRRISCCVPMHTFGHAVRMDELMEVCNKFNIPVVEDAAESLGTWYNGKHTGTFGKLGILSYNGNKTVTTGGGGMIITDDEALAKKAKHITTTAKVPHRWDFVHDELGYNYRMTNVSAAIGVAQMEKIDFILSNKRETADAYRNFFAGSEVQFFAERDFCKSNYWLNVVLLKDKEERDKFLTFTNDNGVMTRPIWTLMNKLQMYSNCPVMNLDNSQWLEDRVVNIPSSVRL